MTPPLTALASKREVMSSLPENKAAPVALEPMLTAIVPLPLPAASVGAFGATLSKL